MIRNIFKLNNQWGNWGLKWYLSAKGKRVHISKVTCNKYSTVVMLAINEIL